MAIKVESINFLEYPIPAAAAAAATTARHKKRQQPDLGNQACYHRSAGVKTIGKILNMKIKKNKKNGQKWSILQKMVKIAKNDQNGLKWYKVVQNDSKL